MPKATKAAVGRTPTVESHEASALIERASLLAGLLCAA
jgi:hypothetical protein